jgi:hypothetical protein
MIAYTYILIANVLEINRFTVRTGKQVSFLKELQMLCKEYSSEGDFHFEYYTKENSALLMIEDLVIDTNKGEGFIKSLEGLCQEYAIPIGQAIEFIETPFTSFKTKFYG